MKKTSIRLLSALMVLALLTVPAASAANADDPESLFLDGYYTDVPPSVWYESAALWTVSAGIFSPTSKSTFSPGETLSRIQFLGALWRSVGAPDAVDGSRFDDVTAVMPGAPAVFWATGNGVTTGISARSFDPHAPLTRQQAAVFLYRCAGLPAGGTAAEIPDFADWDNVAPWAADAMVWAVESGLLRGLSGGLLAPEEPVTRAQAAVLLQRYREYRNAETE